jgi:hypothetical protein
MTMTMDWYGLTDLITIMSVLVAIAALAFAVWHARIHIRKLTTQAEFLADHTEFLRKQLHGEVYDKARVRNLQMCVPARIQREVKGFKQKDEEETLLGEYVAIPVGSERELHICWEMAETQTLRGYRVGFEGNYLSKPEILGMELAFQKKVFQISATDEYIDWNGYFHREYTRLLRCPKGSSHYVALRVLGNVEGKYSLHVRVRVDEAPEPFEGTLTVDCISKPNEWAEKHWC